MVHNSKIWVRWGYMIFSKLNKELRGEKKVEEEGKNY